MANKLGKRHGYVADMASTGLLQDTLERHGINAAYHPNEEKLPQDKAVLLIVDSKKIPTFNNG